MTGRPEHLTGHKFGAPDVHMLRMSRQQQADLATVELASCYLVVNLLYRTVTYILNREARPYSFHAKRNDILYWQLDGVVLLRMNYERLDWVNLTEQKLGAADLVSKERADLATVELEW